MVSLTRAGDGLEIGGTGEVIDWLVVMLRLDPLRTLEARLAAGDLGGGELDRLADTLARFYRHAEPVRATPAAYLSRWRAALVENRQVLLDPRLAVPPGPVRVALAAQHRFLERRPRLLADRARRGRIVDAHGDLRPEHIWMGPPVKIIDTSQEHAPQAAVPQVSGETGRRLPVVFEEGGIGIDPAVEPLSQHQFGPDQVQVRVEVRTWRISLKKAP